MKRVFLTTLLLLTLTLTACGSTSSDPQASSTQESASLPVETQLVVGTFKLEDTEQAVTGEQAKELLVMWQVYQDLNSSDTAAQAEIDGLVEQIQGTMTTEQMEAISAMNLTQQDIFATMQEKNVNMVQAQQSNSDDSFSFSPSAGGGPSGGGGMPGGAPPDGGGMASGAPPDDGMGGMGGTSTDQNQEVGAGLGGDGTVGVPTALMDALIQYLQEVANA